MGFGRYGGGSFIGLHCDWDRRCSRSKYSVLLYDCQNDDRVRSEVLDQRESLTRAGYSLILGLRDLYPAPLSDLNMVAMRIRTRVPTIGVRTYILLAVAEIEAWFIQDETHFARIDSALNVDTFSAKFGFNPRTQSAETVAHPSKLLHQIYSSVGKAYRKTRIHVERTVQVLDYAALCFTQVQKLPHLRILIAYLDGFFA